MADAASSPQYTVPDTFREKTLKFVWAMTGTSTGQPVRACDFGDKTFQHWDVSASWGGATLVWQGSNDERANPAHASYSSSQWESLTDTTETALSFVAADGGGQVLQNYEWIRPITTGGTATAVTATLLVRK